MYSQTGYVEVTNPSDPDYQANYLKDFWGEGTSSCSSISVPYDEWCCSVSGPTNTCSANWMGGFCAVSKREITPMQMGRTHRNAMLTSLRKYVKVSSTLEPDHLITSNETWEFDIRMYSNIIVKTGNKLTLKCRVLMPPGSKIIVEKGAELIVDGAIITTVDDTYLWQGIEVWGDHTKSQHAYNGVLEQGKLTVKNDALIENANEAIRLWNPNDWNSPGGIVIAQNSTFRNNRRNVEFIAYENHVPNSPSNILNNISIFKECTFEHTKNLNNGANPQTMVTMWRVRGIRFSGCTFRYVVGPEYNPSFYRVAIGTLDGGYYIRPSCNATSYPCPPSNTIKCLFDNFTIGVEATGSCGYFPISINNSEFIDCNTGVVIDNVDDVKMVSNSFDNPTRQVNTGIYITNATGYVVEENTFTANSAYTFQEGVVVDNSGGEYNELYKNTFNGIGLGILSLNDNFVFSTSTFTKGLKFNCNSLNNTSNIDIGISSGNGASVVQSGGTNTQYQSISAANVFSPNAIFNYFNASTLGVQVMYSGGTGNTMPVNNTNVITNLGSSNTCPPKFSGKVGQKLSSEELLLEKSGFESAQVDYSNSLYMYFLALDGGDSEELIQSIESSYSSQSVALRNKLIVKSPLTLETILVTIEEDILSNSQLYDVLTYNPELIRFEEVIYVLENKTNPFTQMMITALVNQSLTPQDKDLLENEVSYYNGLRKDHSNAVINHYLFLDEQGDFDSLQVWLNKTNTEHHTIKRNMDLAISLNNVTNINNAIASWQNKQYIVPEFETERTLLTSFYNTYTSNFLNDGQLAWPTSSSFYAELAALSASNNSYTSKKAENIIRFNEMGEYIVPTSSSNKTETESSFSKYRKNTTDLSNVIELAFEVVIFPNPNKGTFTIQVPSYTDEKMNFRITNIQSVTLKEGIIRDKNTQVILDVSQGIYIVEIMKNAEVIKTLQLIIK